METKGAKGYFFAFFLVQTAIAAPLLFRTMFPLPQSRIPGIIIFFILLLTGSLTFFENKKLVPFLQIIAGLSMIGCIAVITLIGPMGEILFETFGGTPYIRRIFARVPAYSLSVSPFHIIWLLDDMFSSGVGRGFLQGMFGGKPFLLYYIHGGIGFVFWLGYLIFISFRNSRWGKSRTGNYRSEQDNVKVDTGALTEELQKLHAFVKENLSERLKELERYRRIARSNILHGYIYFGLTAAGVLILGWQASIRLIDTTPGVGFLYLFIIAAWVFMFLSFWPRRVAKEKKGYVQEFKRRIISPLIEFIDPTLSYKPEGKIDKEVVEKGGMVSTNRGVYNGADLVIGIRNDRPFAFSNVSIIERTFIYSGYRTLFHGLYVTVSLQSSFPGNTYIIPKRRNFKQLHRDVKIGEQISSGNEQFDNLYSIYATNREQVKTMLPSDYVEKCLAFIQEQNASIIFAFLGGPAQPGQSYRSVQTEMHAAVSRQKFPFDPPIFSSLYDFDIFVRCFQELKLCLEIVDFAV